MVLHHLHMARCFTEEQLVNRRCCDVLNHREEVILEVYQGVKRCYCSLKRR